MVSKARPAHKLPTIFAGRVTSFCGLSLLSVFSIVDNAFGGVENFCGVVRLQECPFNAKFAHEMKLATVLVWFQLGHRAATRTGTENFLPRELTDGGSQLNGEIDLLVVVDDVGHGADGSEGYQGPEPKKRAPVPGPVDNEDDVKEPQVCKRDHRCCFDAAD